MSGKLFCIGVKLMIDVCQKNLNQSWVGCDRRCAWARQGLDAISKTISIALSNVEIPRRLWITVTSHKFIFSEFLVPCSKPLIVRPSQ